MAHRSDTKSVPVYIVLKMFLRPLVAWDSGSATARLCAVETRLTPLLILVLTLPVSEGLFFLTRVFVSCLEKNGQDFAQSSWRGFL